MKTNREILSSIRAMGDFRGQRSVEFKVGNVSIDHSPDHRTHQLFKRRLGILHQFRFDKAVDLLDVSFVQRNKQCLFIRKVLVNRTDANPCHLGHPVGSDRFNSFPL